MSVSLASIARATTNQMYTGLDRVLQKGAAHAAAHKTDEAVYLNWRLAADMFPLSAQVRLATEIPARGLSRLAGAEIPSFPDTEQNFAELRARIARARGIIAGLPENALAATPDADITAPMGKESRTFRRIDFLQQFILPNLYFHVTATYLILRHIGVEVGKLDYLSLPGR